MAATIKDVKSLRGAITYVTFNAKWCRRQAAMTTNPNRAAERLKKAAEFEDAAARLSCLLDNVLGANDAVVP